MRDPYGPNRDFAAPARDGTTAFTFVASALAVFIIWSFLRGIIVTPLASEGDIGVSKASFAVEMAAFALLISLVAIAMRRIHGRHWHTLLGTRTRFRSDLTRVLLATLALSGVLIALGFDTSAAMQRPVLGWLAFLPIALLVIAVQTGAEELFFRGYLQQYVARHVTAPYAWMVIPSVLFGLVHAGNDPSTPAAAAAYVVWTTAFGVACADLTARTGSLGAAWGLHIGVNMSALLLAAQESAPMSAAALYLFPERAFDYQPEAALIWMGTIFELVFLFILWLGARNAIER